jgi:protein-tyrosine phosphatase
VQPQWIELDGTVNTRDVGGLPVTGGGTTLAHRLIRSDNLQSLTDGDVRRLVDDYGVRTVTDLRTGVEVESEGPGPLTREPLVDIEHLSLFPEAGRNTDAGALDDEADEAAEAAEADDAAPVTLPWQDREQGRGGVSGVYLGYLDARPDSVVAALRAIANSDGATIVHCAAGKDRTGVVVALALAEIGVEPDAIVADYAASADHIDAVMARLRASHTYAGDLVDTDDEKHRPRAATMERFLDGLDQQHGGPGNWLRSHGWTEHDSAALRQKLLVG